MDMNSEEEMNQLPEGNIRFLQQKRPMLKAGVYDIGIDHEIIINKGLDKPEDTISVSKKFAVRGERFQLDAGDIHSTFPPENAAGDFSRCLPHIVLKTDTLPWERSAGVSVKKEQTPWLALMLFHEDEISKIVEGTRKLSDLSRPDEWLESKSGESLDDQCTILEVPEDLLGEIAPSVDDLAWLCHIRQVSNDRKEDTNDGHKSDFAVIIGNRLPEMGKKNRVHLVSLEGYYDKERKEWYAPVDGRVQLVSLKSWDFTSKGESHSFTDEMGELVPGVLKSPGAADDQLKDQILASGYTLLRHQMRQGDKTVSLYRGPLVPSSVPLTIKLPITCADEVVRLYQEWGLFDVSYAAAWQLGRLLALQNRDFSIALYQWKRERRLKTLIQKGKEMTEEALGPIDPGAREDSEVDEEIDRYAEVNRWLAGLKTLSDIPLHYLVPDLETMLPEKSIRFFHVDLNWTQSLTDGAFSLGRATTADLRHDKESHLTINIQADHTARMLRKNLGSDSDSENGEKSFETITGILIRSDIIVNWPGLEVEAYGDGEPDNRLPFICMKRLADNILICLFEGELARADIHPPAEGLHYCVEENMMLRDPRNGASLKAPDFDTGQLFRQADLNVLDVAGLAEKIKKQFKLDDPQFTSAQFGLSLIAPGNHVTFLKAGL
ncbi:MAG: hypothetical protein BA869_07575 [Desulfuromonadales bacterium C00003107]|nr:MAG: hypothetical protein BA869_07575 [Desulfuromonadales bacterium C00003107]